MKGGRAQIEDPIPNPGGLTTSMVSPDSPLPFTVSRAIIKKTIDLTNFP